MTNTPRLLKAFAAALLLSACAKEAPTDAATTAASTPTSETEPAVAPDAAAPSAAGAEFDLSTVAVSPSPQGAWPYVTAPDGYQIDSARTVDLAQVPFWNGQALQPVEGKVFECHINAVGDKEYSRLEVLKRIDQSLTALGAHKIGTAQIPKAVLDAQLPPDFGVEFNTGAGGYYPDQELTTYVLRTPDHVIWFKVSSNVYSASLLVAETDAPAPAPATG